jgi:hypothetical protein
VQGHGLASNGRCYGRAVERPTVDMNVLRAALSERESGHADAMKLLELAAKGVLELAVPPQGALADFDADLTTERGEQVRALIESPGVVELDQLPWPSAVTFPSPRLFPGGEPVPGFGEAWAAITADWNGPGHLPNEKDRWYVESHIAAGRDVLVTNDKGMRTACGRLRDEYGIDVRAGSLADYAARWS